MTGYLDRGDTDVPPMSAARWAGLGFVLIGAAGMVLDGRVVDVPVLASALLIVAGALFLGPFRAADGRFEAATPRNFRIAAAVLVAAALAVLLAFSQGA